MGNKEYCFGVKITYTNSSFTSTTITVFAFNETQARAQIIATAAMHFYNPNDKDEIVQSVELEEEID